MNGHISFPQRSMKARQIPYFLISNNPPTLLGLEGLVLPLFRKQTTQERLALAKKLVQAREEAGYLQKNAAKELGIPPSVLCNVESGNRKIDASELKALADLYRKPIEWFFQE